MHLATARLPVGLGKVRGPMPWAVAVCPRAGVVWQSEPRRTTSMDGRTMTNACRRPRFRGSIMALAAALAGVAGLAACGLPSAMGEANSLIVVADDALWEQVEEQTYEALERTVYTTRNQLASRGGNVTERVYGDAEATANSVAAAMPPGPAPMMATLISRGLDEPSCATGAAPSCSMMNRLISRMARGSSR